MPVLLFSLQNVPEDESNDIRNLMSEHAIDYYETTAGNWGISLAAIWLPDATQFAHARQLIDEYQQQRAFNQRRLYEQSRLSGRQATVWSNFNNHPGRFVFYTLAVAAIIYLSAQPFLMGFQALFSKL